MAHVFSRQPNLGFSLVEVVVALAIFGLSISVIELIITAVRADASVVQRIKARSLILDQAEVLRNMNFDDIPLGNFSEFVGDVWHLGDWTVSSINSQVLTAQGTGEHVILIPGDRWQDSQLNGELYVDPDTPSGYDVGIVVRAQDEDTRYRFRLTNDAAVIEKEIDGIVTALANVSNSLPPGTWEDFSFEVTGDQLIASIGGVSASVVDSDLTEGHLAVWSQDGCCVSFDNLILTSSKNNASWNFEGDDEGEIPADWDRLTPQDLPGGAVSLVITEGSDPDVKQVEIEVTWLDRTTTRTEAVTLLLSRYGL